ncbi:uncharacterized protein ACNLHF_004386 [Anomaloglossus baeobatrachus]
MMTLPLWTMLMSIVSLAWSLNEELKEDWNNKLIKHHQVLLRDMDSGDRPKNCWICTHSPIASNSMPYLAVPLTPYEVFNYSCFHEETFDSVHYNGGNLTSSHVVPIQIAGWVESPWLQINLTGSLKCWYELDLVEGKFITHRTKKFPVGEIPVKGLKLSLRCPHSKDWERCESTSIIRDDRCFQKRNHGLLNNSELWFIDAAQTCERLDPFNYPFESKTCRGNEVGFQNNRTWCAKPSMQGFLTYVRCLGRPTDIIPCILPKDLYLVCGHQAYKWLPPGAEGTCILARLTPATFILPHGDLDINAVPKHSLYRRAADDEPRQNGRPHIVEMGVANRLFSSMFIYPFIIQMWNKLVESTDYLDDQIWEVLGIVNQTNAVQAQIITVVNQHTIVLDYLTAKEGGVCQIIGPSCCHYIDPKGNFQVKAKMEIIKEMRDKWLQEHHENKDSWWNNTFSFLNPANWFKGIGGWLMGILQGILQMGMLILLVYVAARIGIFIVTTLCKETRKIKHHRPSVNTSAKHQSAPLVNIYDEVYKQDIYR